MEKIFKDLNWEEDWGGYSILISQFNAHNKSVESVKVFIQKNDLVSWTEVPSIPTVSAEGYSYSLKDSLQIHYLGSEAVEHPVIRIIY
ncbi:MAG TPA: hypothetical protein VGD17_19245 [Chitinophagaceae bacterium]